jgi:hypothetical protein
MTDSNCKLLALLAAVFLLPGCARPGALIASIAVAAAIASNSREHDHGQPSCQPMVRIGSSGSVTTVPAFC